MMPKRRKGPLRYRRWKKEEELVKTEFEARRRLIEKRLRIIEQIHEARKQGGIKGA